MWAKHTRITEIPPIHFTSMEGEVEGGFANIFNVHTNDFAFFTGSQGQTRGVVLSQACQRRGPSLPKNVTEGAYHNEAKDDGQSRRPHANCTDASNLVAHLHPVMLLE